jgi:hypothetical protein
MFGLLKASDENNRIRIHVRSTDPRIRILTKISRIRNTGLLVSVECVLCRAHIRLLQRTVFTNLTKVFSIGNGGNKLFVFVFCICKLEVSPRHVSFGNRTRGSAVASAIAKRYSYSEHLHMRPRQYDIKTSIVDPDPHEFSSFWYPIPNLDRHPQQIKIQIRIRILISWIRNRIRIRINLQMRSHR